MKNKSADPLAEGVVLLGIILVGLLDYVTGIEVRVFSLYFIPLVYSAKKFGRRGALSASLFATLSWFVSKFWGGLIFSHPSIWVINSVTQGIAFVAVSLLVASLHDAHAREQALSRTDSLTGLLNSRAFNERAAIALALCHRGKRPATLAFMDLDNFKNVNDSAGHQQGDKLLKKVADVLSGLLRSSDIISRIGGDEFSIFLPETNAIQAQAVLNKIKEELLLTKELQAFSVSASIGAVSFTEPPDSLSILLREADTLMYSVKANGKNSVKIQSYP